MERLAGQVILLWGWRRALAAFAAGAFAALSQAPYEFFAAGFVSFPVLVWLLDGAVADGGGPLRRLAPAFSVGWWFGFGYFLVGLWWVGVAVLVDGRAAWALPFAVMGLPAFLALFYGLAAAVARCLWSDGIGRIAALAFAFGLAEWLRATLFTGFPWNAIGYAAMPVPLLMQSVKVTGLYGMNALAVFVFSLPALLATGRHLRTGLALGAALVAAHLAYGYARLATAPAARESLQVRIVQPSISQTEKWDRTARDRIFNTYLDLSGSPGEEGAPPPQLIVWPETAFPFLLADRPDALASLADLVGDGQTLLAGAVRREGAGTEAGRVRYYNAIVQINSAGEVVDAVDKVHLVPFGEYVPLGDWLRRIGVNQLVESIGPFSSGVSRRPIQVADGISAMPYICYEIIFPQLIVKGGSGADFIVNVTNDAWFGDTAGPYQHFMQARVRAVEAGVPLVRAANSGISAVVDAYGRVVDALAVGAFGTLDAAVPLTRGDTLSLGTARTNGLVIVTFFGVFALMAGVLRFRSN